MTSPQRLLREEARSLSEIRPGVRRAVGVALVLDALVILAYLGFLLSRRREGFALFRDWWWDADQDRTVAEILGSGQLVAAAVVLLVLVLQQGRRVEVYLPWSLLFVMMAVDHLGQGHEKLSRLLRERYELPVLPGLRTNDTGELLGWAAFGLVPLLLVVLLHRRADVPARHDSWRLAAVTALLASAAVGIDMVDVALRDHVGDRVTTAMIGAESSGELLGCTVVLALTLALATRAVPGASRLPG